MIPHVRAFDKVLGVPGQSCSKVRGVSIPPTRCARDAARRCERLVGAPCRTSRQARDAVGPTRCAWDASRGCGTPESSQGTMQQPCAMYWVHRKMPVAMQPSGDRLRHSTGRSPRQEVVQRQVHGRLRSTNARSAGRYGLEHPVGHRCPTEPQIHRTFMLVGRHRCCAR